MVVERANMAPLLPRDRSVFSPRRTRLPAPPGDGANGWRRSDPLGYAHLDEGDVEGGGFGDLDTGLLGEPLSHHQRLIAGAFHLRAVGVGHGDRCAAVLAVDQDAHAAEAGKFVDLPQYRHGERLDQAIHGCGVAAAPDDASAGFLRRRVEAVEDGDLPLVDLRHTAEDLRLPGAERENLVRARPPGLGVGPGGRRDAPAGVAVAEHRQADTAVELQHCGHPRVADVGPPCVQVLRIAEDGGRTGEHAATPLANPWPPAASLRHQAPRPAGGGARASGSAQTVSGTRRWASTSSNSATSVISTPICRPNSSRIDMAWSAARFMASR